MDSNSVFLEIVGLIASYSTVHGFSLSHESSGDADLPGGTTMAEFSSMADSSITARPIPVLFLGHCWGRQ